MKILFVCTGNTCRSPMAQAIAEDYIKKHNIKNIEVSSCGIYPEIGANASKNAVEVMKELGIDISNHKARQFDANDITDSDIIAVMSPQHMALLSVAGVPEDKIIILGGGIHDPYGSNIDTYRSCRDKISLEVTALIDKITGVREINDDK